MGRTCQTCVSPYLPEYEDLYSKGAKISSIYLRAKGNKDPVTYSSLLNHFRNHSKNRIKNLDTKYQATILSEEFKVSLGIVRSLNNSLNTLNCEIDNLLKSPNKDLDRLLQLITETRLTAETIRSFINEPRFKELTNKTEDVFDIILKCLYDLPEDILRKLRERYEEYTRTGKVSKTNYLG